MPAEGMAAMTNTYHVAALRWEHGWELHIEGVGVTQCESLDEAELMIRDYLHCVEHDDWETADIALRLTFEKDWQSAA
jgi:hypothetical protein